MKIILNSTEGEPGKEDAGREGGGGKSLGTDYGVATNNPNGRWGPWCAQKAPGIRAISGSGGNLCELSIQKWCQSIE